MPDEPPSPASPEHEPERSGADAGRQRAAFDRFELAAVLSHYDTGVVESIREFPRGSLRSPKLLIKCDRGLCLLKRRAPGRGDARRVSFCHAVQLHLLRAHFPAPRLHRTRRSGSTILRVRGFVYELFDFVHGGGYDGSEEATRAAGRELAIFHDALSGFDISQAPADSDAAGADATRRTLAQIPARLTQIGHPASDAELETLSRLDEACDRADARAQLLGASDWPQMVIHGDWHPGNALFHEGDVVAVIDFDAVRVDRRALDVAAGALQFSVVGGGPDPQQWPEALHRDRFLSFCRGYDEAAEKPLTKSERDAMPQFMVQALIAEAAGPIAATGRFAELDGGVFLGMIERKAKWLEDNAQALTDLIG